MKTSHAFFLIVFMATVFSHAVATPDCAARRCLESPYGPGMAPGCVEQIESIQQAIVRGEGLPDCTAPSRDFSSGWYWRAMGWVNCPADTHADDPAHCGNYRQETLPLLIPFVPGTATPTTTGEALISEIESWLSTSPRAAIRLIGVSQSASKLASSELAQRRLDQAAQRIKSAGGNLTATEINTRNLASGTLVHGVWISAIGRGFSANKDLLGRGPVNGKCGLVHVTTGSVNKSIDRALRHCGYALAPLKQGGAVVDYTETREKLVQSSSEVDDVLRYFRQQYGFEFETNDFEVRITDDK